MYCTTRSFYLFFNSMCVVQLDWYLMGEECVFKYGCVHCWSLIRALSLSVPCERYAAFLCFDIFPLTDTMLIVLKTMDHSLGLSQTSDQYHQHAGIGWTMIARARFRCSSVSRLCNLSLVFLHGVAIWLCRWWRRRKRQRQRLRGLKRWKRKRQQQLRS